MSYYKVDWNKDSGRTVKKKLIKYFEEYGTGEGIYQSDSAQIEGLEMLAELADILNVESKEE